MLEAINETISYIKQQVKLVPDTAIILGTGLGDIIHGTEQEREIYEGRLHTGLGSVAQLIAIKRR